MFIQMKAGELVETFDNGCVVVMHDPRGCEVCITAPDQAFPIRPLIVPSGESWRGSAQEAREKAEKLVRVIHEKCGTVLPDHLSCK